MAIDAKELRIGNYVKDPQIGFKDYFKVSIGDILTLIAEPALYEPIPLTTEILEKCGFEQNYANNKIFFINIGRPLRLEIFDNTSVWIGDTEIINIQYLHQLQNLYYCLTGKELEIKL